MKKAGVIAASVAVLVGAGVLWSVSSQTAQANLAQAPAQQGQQALSTVNVVSPTLNQAASSIQFSARLAPEQEASLFARATGFVESRTVDIGTKVKAGQVLARISAPELEASLNSAKAAQAQRQAELLVATRNRERVEPLLKEGAVSAQQLDEVAAIEEVAKANLTAAKAEVARLQSEVSYLVVRAPFDGVITERNIDRGDRVSPNDTRMLFRIINSEALRVLVDVPQPQFFRLNTAEQATLALQEKPGEPIKVSFKRSASEVRADTGTVRLEYALDNREPALPAGLNGSLNIPSNGQGVTVTVPANTIVYRDGGATVAVVNAQDEVEFRKISLGKNFANSVEVLQGIGEKDRVVINPNALLRAGQKVAVNVQAAG